MDYESLKALAKASKVKVTDLLALAPQNDPFYVGTPASVEQGNWFANLWQRFGYGFGVHIRRVHYQIISQDPPVLLPDGTPYQNTLECWQYLVSASKQARYLGLVDAYSFVDRRNPDADSFTLWSSDDALEVTGHDLPDESLPDFPDLPSVYYSGARVPQAYRLEVWAEKSTMNDVLIPWCQKYGATLQTGLGELSITAVTAFVNRCKADSRRTVVLYVSDFDPAGRSMPVAIARKIEFLTVDTGLQVMLFPVVLTPDQVQQYHLPRTPIKESERRGAKFEARFGEGAVELDALEALYPGRLTAILTRFVLDNGLFDRDLNDRCQQRADNFRKMLRDITAPTRLQFAYQDLESKYNDLRNEMASRYAAIKLEWDDLRLDISRELEAQFPDLPALPEASQGPPQAEPLLDTSRGYIQQLVHYRLWQGKDVQE